ncbi:MAG: DUF2804 domain-containing protein [Promethearchaeota archaeon]
MQNEITKPSNVFRKNGALMQRGWARKPILNYNREEIVVKWHRIKEWSHYSIQDKEQGFGFQMTIGDIGYLTLMGFTWLDYKNRTCKDRGSVRFLTRGKYTWPRSSLQRADIKFPGWNFSAIILQRKNKRILSVNYPRFKGLKGNIVLYDDPKMDNTVVLTGYKEDHRKFYYNHKINYMPAKGTLRFNKKTYILKPETSFGLLDWGRGVWPYKTHWLWGSACGKVNGISIAFNIGYGFGDLSTHTENIVFFDGKAHKLDKVIFHNENRDPAKPWTFTSNDDRFNMVLNPIIPRKSRLNIGILLTDSRIIHGYYSGYIILDNDEKIQIKNLLGHAEDIYWRW